MASDWLLRVLALVPLMTLALLWSGHHLGLGIGQTGWIAGIGAALTTAIGAAERMTDKPEQEGAARLTRSWLDQRLTWPRVAALYLAGGLVSMALASVVVVPDDPSPQARTKVVLTPTGTQQSGEEKDLEAKGEPARFVVGSSPFGRLFRLEVDGYVPETIEVFPIVGRTIRPSRDLRRSPALLIRLSDLAKGSLDNEKKGRLTVLQRVGNRSTEIARSDEARRAFLIGRMQSVPPAQLSAWRTELEAKGVADASLVARHLQDWSKPQALASSVLLAPGMNLRVQVINAAGNVVASSDFLLGDAEYQEIGVEDLL